jgi:hypothetical protein
MAKQLSETEGKKILGVAGTNVRNGNIRADEFLPELRGKRAIRKYREMRDNDATIGSAMYAVEQMLRDVPIKVTPKDESEEAKSAATFIEEVLEDMDHTLDDHISEALSFLTFGFSTFEVVYKRRVGPYERSPKKRSKYTDGYIGIRKLAPRAQWTINRFDVDDKSGDVLGYYQDVSSGYSISSNYIPMRKSLYYRTTAINGDPSGRSILRNAYASYERLNSIQQYEAIGIERELAGIPHAEVPADYLSPDATDSQVAFVNSIKEILRDVKFNEQGYLITPSDTYPGKDGEPTNQKLVSVRLMSSEGSRNIDIDPVVKRYQHDIARSVLAEFIMLGGGSNGSYALSKSKSDLFLRALESYIQTIVDALNKQLVEALWRINGFDFKSLPKITAGDVAPHDLKELGAYLRNLNGAGISYADDLPIVNALLEQAELPSVDEETYRASRERAHQSEMARADYYDGTDDNVVGSKDKTSEEDDRQVDGNAGED